MGKMSRLDLEPVLEECLEQLRKGASLEQVLAAFPAQAAELRPLLEVALWAQSLSAGIQVVPSAAQARSRARFLAAAGQAQSTPRASPSGLLRFRLAAVVLLLVMLVSASLLGTGLVSAQSLPGEPLYPVKIAIEQARLWLAGDSASYLHLEELFDQRRVAEVLRLLQQGRMGQQVSFAGFLSVGSEGGWQVAGIPVAFASEAGAPAPSLLGTYLEVQGRTAAGQVQVESFRLRRFHLTGRIEEMRPALWRVSGVLITIAPETAVHGQPAPGSLVTLTALRIEADRLLALSVRVETAAAQVTTPAAATAVLSPQTRAPQAQPQPSAAPELRQMETEEKERHSGDQEKSKTPDQEDQERPAQQTPKPNEKSDSDKGGEETRSFEPDESEEAPQSD